MNTSTHLFIRIFIACFSFLCSGMANSSAVPYEVIQDTNTSIGSLRTRANITIYAPTAQDKTSRADTVKQAIDDKVRESGVMVVTASLIPSKNLLGAGALLAQGDYYADGCGPSGSTCNGIKLVLSATNIKLSAKTIRVWEQSVKSTNELAEKGIFDDEKITADVAKKLKMEANEIDLPYIELEPVTTEKSL